MNHKEGIMDRKSPFWSSRRHSSGSDFPVGSAGKLARPFVVSIILIVLGVAVFVVWRSRLREIEEVTVSETASPGKEGPFTARKKLPGLGAGTLPGLRRLSEYQDICGSFVSDRMMCFVSFPEDREQAMSIALGLAPKLKEFHRVGVSPIVIFEPKTGSGKYVSLVGIASGEYDPFLRDLFSFLSENGVTGEMIGEWVPYPEINAPIWDRKGFSPGDFSVMVNRFFPILRSRYPAAKGTILMNAASYDPSDTEWAHARYEDFSPYIRGIAPGNLESFGIQGFPWKSGRRDGSAFMSPDAFLHVELAVSAAKRLGVNRIWINSGTFGTMRKGGASVSCAPAERAVVLGGLLRKARQLRREGYSVSINLFAENKAGTAEAVDWSYGNLNDRENSLRNVLFSFAKKADALGVGIRYFGQ